VSESSSHAVNTECPSDSRDDVVADVDDPSASVQTCCQSLHIVWPHRWSASVNHCTLSGLTTSTPLDHTPGHVAQ